MINPDTLSGDFATLYDYACKRMWQPEAKKTSDMLKGERSCNLKGINKDKYGKPLWTKPNKRDYIRKAK